MSRVVLVYPSTGLDLRGLSVWLPLSVLNVASTLAPDFDVAIVDQRIDAAWPETLRRLLGSETLCVGVSSMTGTQLKGALAAAQVVREVDPGIPLVWGGNHATLVPISTARHPLVDIVVMGEGERTFRRLVEALEKKADWRAIPSLAYRDGDRVERNGTGTEPDGFVDPAAQPPLPYHLVDIESYISGPAIFGRPLRALPYISSQGCPYSCSFCCQPVLSRRRWRRQPPELVLERTLALKERYALDAIEFHDEEFFVDRKRGARIAEMIGGAYEWYVQTRMDDLLALDLAALHRHGLRVVQPGLETGSPRILELIRKEETVEQFLEANRRLAGSGIRATYNFMMGYPTETIEDLTATVDLALALIEANPGASIAGFYVYVPYPGAELFERAVADGFREPETIEAWSAFNRQHLESPWIQDRRKTLEMLLYTSKFIDGTRLKRTFQGNPLYGAALSLLSSFYRRRWKRHDFRHSLDIDLIAFAARRIFNW